MRWSKNYELVKCCKLGFGLLLVPLLASPAISEPIERPAHLHKEQAVDIVYSGRVFGIPMIRAKVSAVLLEESYAMRAEFRTSGLAAFFKQIKVIASAQGIIGDNRLFTKEYWHKELDGRKNRELFMSFEPDNVTLRVIPPLRTMGDPPATMQQRLEALDPVSAVLALSMGNEKEKNFQNCQGSLKVFDGKQRYNLRLEAKGKEKIRTRAYKGLAMRCHVWYIPISGFNADDLNDPGYEKPVIMWLADEPFAGLRLPVKFSYKLDFATAVVEARSINVR
ncbi:MAG: DUF3108 domain-containing protein [Robiginitomaculum sp.]|nr:DUF3108 domain-containing protein [Robiginitomaculum sp.]